MTDQSLHEDLSDLGRCDVEEAYSLITARDPARQKKLLYEYERGGRIADLICSRIGADHCAGLLYGMGAERLWRRLRELGAKNRDNVLVHLAHRLTREDVDTAANRLRDYAAVDPECAAWLLSAIATLDTPPAFDYKQRAIELVPSAGFLLALKDEPAQDLMGALLFKERVTERGQRESVPVLVPHAPGLLHHLVAEDSDRTARLLAGLDSVDAFAAAVRSLPFDAAVSLLRALSRVSIEASDDVLSRLPWRLAAVFRSQMTREATTSASGWSWLDALLTLWAYRSSAPRANSDELRKIWHAARSAQRDITYYRRQRNVCLGLSGALVLLVLVLILM
ncbi:hypothetical protein ACU635_08045 [[Actinomadura] parvosata]|uniref:hypothetical protein n=1 Tax=[Actinomadura] parvosata TaxID=1955412 RepID=UPI00406C240D